MVAAVIPFRGEIPETGLRAPRDHVRPARRAPR
jgi:hypothetical protein